MRIGKESKEKGGRSRTERKIEINKRTIDILSTSHLASSVRMNSKFF